MGRIRPNQLLALLAASLAISPISFADNAGLAGFEVGQRGSRHAYVGTIIVPESVSPWRGRLWLDHTRYEYDKAGQDVRARVTGAEAALGIGGSRDADWWAVYLGPRWESTRLSPDDRGNDNRGSHARAKLLAEAEQGVGNWRAILGASYVFGADGWWMRGRMLRPQPAGSRFGGELVLHGGPDYRATQLGGLYQIPLGKASSALFKGGVRHDRDLGSGGYAGVELYWPY